MNHAPPRRSVHPSTTPLAGALLVAAVLAACAAPDSGRPDPATRARALLVAAEDARPAGGPEHARLVEGLASADARVRAFAARGLGRLERPASVGALLPLLDDPDPGVRRAAADALAQSVHGSDGGAVAPPLLRRLRSEEDARAAGAVARSLGRLRLPASREAEVDRALVAASRGPDGEEAEPDRLLGVVLAMESRVRRAGGDGAASPLLARLQALATRSGGRGAPGTHAERVRAVAVSALGQAGVLGVRDVERALADPAERVRLAGARWLTRVPAAERRPLVDEALDDPWHQVRWAAVDALATGPREAPACRRLAQAAGGDPDTGVRLRALDGLAGPCGDAPGVRELLEEAAGTLPEGDDPDWHVAAHALVSLASVEPAAATALLPRFVDHPNPFVRAWGARAAGLLGSRAGLDRLVDDPDPNVQGVALDGLASAGAPDVTAVTRRALASATDPQLVILASARLAGTPPSPPTLDAALAALERLSDERAMTHRDARVAALDLAEAMGGEDDVDRVAPYLRDWDPAVADRAAQVLGSWTGDPWLAAPRPSPGRPVPSVEEIQELTDARIVLHMRRGGRVVIELDPLAAPTNAHRFADMVERGVVDDLTFHRVVPNFVIQGLSPAANEYAGHGAYTRDEVGLAPHWRGTVGISTRGRDTGDGQIFVNLVDNLRLDHDYTVIGEVVEGMDVVDDVLEGDVVERAELRIVR